MRELLLRERQLLPRHRSAWTQVGIAALEKLAKPLGEVSMDELWRGLEEELAQFKAVQAQMTEVVAKLDALGAANHNVRLLQTASGVGPRLAEAVVTMFDDPRRFRRGASVSAYIGMVPKQWDSGETERLGKITRHGNRLVRSLLVEVAWCALRHNPWARETCQRISGGFRFLHKPVHALLIGSNACGQYFQRNFALQLCILCEIHVTHPARAKFRDGTVMRERRAAS
jgi:transposase